jgi:hypothetical protein
MYAGSVAGTTSCVHCWPSQGHPCSTYDPQYLHRGLPAPELNFCAGGKSVRPCLEMVELIPSGEVRPLIREAGPWETALPSPS